ncbi:hypothetical protein AMTRI_Chr01g111620 [Amborella trichopoda]
MTINSFNIIVILNNVVTVPATALSLPCQVAARPRCLDFLTYQSQCIIYLYIGHRIMLCPFTILHNWLLPIVFHCSICLFVIMILIFIICVLLIIGVHVLCHVSFIGCCNVFIIIHIGIFSPKEIMV